MVKQQCLMVLLGGLSVIWKNFLLVLYLESRELVSRLEACVDAVAFIHFCLLLNEFTQR